MSRLRTKIVSIGKYLPPRIVKNAELEKLMDTSDEWIQQRTGMKERRWAEPGETVSGMGAKASEDALKRAGLKADDIDAIIFSCLLSDFPFPGSAPQIQHKLGFTKTVPALDVRTQCAGFLYPLQIADAWIQSGFYKRVLIVTSEIHNTTLNYTTEGRDTAILFGDGAAATIVEGTTENTGILNTVLHSEGQYAEILSLQKPSPNDHPRIPDHPPRNIEWCGYMEGRLVFKHAVTRMTEALHEVCKKSNVDPKEINFVIAHQANKRIIDVVMEQMGMALEKTHFTLDRYGNTTAATIPLTLEEAVSLGKVKRGDLVALTAFGSGFVWGATLVRY